MVTFKLLQQMFLNKTNNNYVVFKCTGLIRFIVLFYTIYEKIIKIRQYL